MSEPGKRRLVMPYWHLALEVIHIPGVYWAFRDMLEKLPMTHAELADELGVSRPTVTRWASGAARPALEDMARTVVAVEKRLEEIRERVERAGEVVSLAERAVELHEERPAAGDERSRMKFRRKQAAEMSKISSKLDSLVEVIGPEGEPL